MRIQKSLILDFDFNSAQDSALEDWKIDIERESFERKSHAGGKLPQIPEDEGEEDEEAVMEIEYERLSEFFFDLCLSWC